MKRFSFFIFCFFMVAAVRPQSVYVTTIHPIKEIVRAVVGRQDNVSELLPPGASAHTYEPRPSDLVKVQKAKALIMGGKNLDDWAFKFQSPHQIALVSLIPEDHVLLLESRTDIVHFKDSHSHSGIDPHFWTDPIVVKSLLDSLCQLLCAISPEESSIFRDNTRHFARHLDSLDIALAQYLKPIGKKVVMLSHPFFNYFLKRYGVEIAGSVEFSPGTEPTAREIKKMIETIKQKNVTAILIHIQLPDRSARVVAEAAGIQLIELDPYGGKPGRQTFDEILWYNARLILQGLQ
jgi:zinc transport system substrate-binding protein